MARWTSWHEWVSIGRHIDSAAPNLNGTARAIKARSDMTRPLTLGRERTPASPPLPSSRLWREIKELGYTGGYTAVTDYLREVRPREPAPFEVRFETPPGHQAQVDFAQFQVVFTDEPTTMRIVWLFSMVLGHSRLIWARFVLHQD